MSNVFLPEIPYCCRNASHTQNVNIIILWGCRIWEFLKLWNYISGKVRWREIAITQVKFGRWEGSGLVLENLQSVCHSLRAQGSPGQCRSMQPVCGLPTLDRSHMRLIWLGTRCSDCYFQESGYGRIVPVWNLFGCREHWMYNQCPAPCNCVTECRQLTSNALFGRRALRKAENDARNIPQVYKVRLDAALVILTWWWQGGWTGCWRSLKVPSNPDDSSVLWFSCTQYNYILLIHTVKT